MPGTLYVLNKCMLALTVPVSEKIRYKEVGYMIETC